MITPDFDGNAYAKVQDVFTVASRFAQDAYTKAQTFVNAINATVYSPPALTVTWNSLAAPTLPSLPATPSLPSIQFNDLGPTPGSLSLPMPGVQIDDFAITEPTLQEFTAPSVNFGVAPTVPGVADIAVPDAPTLNFPAPPAQLGLNTVTFGGLNLREDWLDRLDDVPELEILEPTPYSYARGPEYASALLEELKAKLLQRMQGGTGLDPVVEQGMSRFFPRRTTPRAATSWTPPSTTSGTTRWSVAMNSGAWIA